MFCKHIYRNGGRKRAPEPFSSPFTVYSFIQHNLNSLKEQGAMFKELITCSDSPVLIVLTVGIFLEPLVTVSKITFKADNRDIQSCQNTDKT